MIKSNKYKIVNSLEKDDYIILISDLYKNYPNVLASKIIEFDKFFSSDNPFFKYAKAANIFLYKDEKIVGHISAFADSRFEDVGTIGFFECENDNESAGILFKNVIDFFKKNGKKQYRGPINGTVWQNFRVSCREDNRPYFLEPFSLSYYRDLFLSNDFKINHENITATHVLNDDYYKKYLNLYDNSISEGYYFDLLNKENAGENILNIYHLTCKIFENSYCFYNISEEEFLYFARQYINIPEPNYIFILKNKAGESVGFFFAVPDMFDLDAKRVIVKTIGLAPSYRGLGLAESMLYFVYQKAKRDDFKELVFSTMSVDNKRIKVLIGEDSVLYRRYEVFGKNII